MSKLANKINYLTKTIANSLMQKVFISAETSSSVFVSEYLISTISGKRCAFNRKHVLLLKRKFTEMNLRYKSFISTFLHGFRMSGHCAGRCIDGQRCTHARKLRHKGNS